MIYSQKAFTNKMQKIFGLKISNIVININGTTLKEVP